MPLPVLSPLRTSAIQCQAATTTNHSLWQHKFSFLRHGAVSLLDRLLSPVVVPLPPSLLCSFIPLFLYSFSLCPFSASVSPPSCTPPWEIEFPLRDNVALLVVVDILLPDQSQSESERPHAAVPPATPDADVSTPTPAAACTHPCDPEGANGKSAASSSPELCPAKRRPAARLVVANTHLLFNPKRGDIKAAQLMVLTGRVERCAGGCGGDLQGRFVSMKAVAIGRHGGCFHPRHMRCFPFSLVM